MNVFARLGKESLIYGAGGVIGRFIGFFLLPIYTRVFAPSTYGVMDVISTTTALFAMILTSGIADTALSFYFFERSDHDDRRRTVVSLMVYIITVTGTIAVFVWYFASPLCMLLFGNSQSAPFLKIAIAAVPFTCINSMHANLLRLQRRPLVYTSFSLSQVLATASLTIWLVIGVKMGVKGVFTANVIIAIMFFIVGAIVNRRFLGNVLDLKRLRELIQYGLPLLIGGLTSWMICYLDRYFLIRMTSLEKIGLYSVGLRIASAMTFVTMSFRLANAPFQFEISKTESAKDAYSKTFIYFCLGTAWCMVAISLAARPTLSIMTPPAYAKAFFVVPIAAFTAVVDGITQIVAVGLLLKRKTNVAGIAMIIGAVMHIAFLWILIPFFNIVGAALAILLSNIIMASIYYFASQRVYRISFALKRMIVTYFSSGIFIVVGIMLQRGNVVLDIGVAVIGMIIWPLFVIFTGIVRREEKTAIFNSLRRLSFGIAGKLR